MPNVQNAFSVEEYNALTSKIVELTKQVEFYESGVNILLEDIEDYKKELMGPDKYDLFMELSDEAKEMMRRSKSKTRLIDLRTGRVVGESYK